MIANYATDGLCHNAEPGTFNHECGAPSTWIGTKPDGFESGFCDYHREHGHEAKAFENWRRRAVKTGAARGLFDEKCLELAKHFLTDEGCTDDAIDRALAVAIQDTVEDWLAHDFVDLRLTADAKKAGAYPPPMFSIEPQRDISEDPDETQFVPCDEADAQHFALFRRNDAGGPESDPFIHVEDFNTRTGAEDHVRQQGGEVLSS